MTQEFKHSFYLLHKVATKEATNDFATQSFSGTSTFATGYGGNVTSSGGYGANATSGGGSQQSVSERTFAAVSTPQRTFEWTSTGDEDDDLAALHSSMARADSQIATTMFTTTASRKIRVTVKQTERCRDCEINYAHF